MQFVINEIAGMESVVALPNYEEATPDLVDAILEEAGKFAEGILAPINFSGDQEGCHWKEGAVTTPKGFKEAYKGFVENGWGSLSCSQEFGGQGLPRLLSTAVREMWNASNMAFSLCPLLTQGAIEALVLCGSDELKQNYLGKMVSGEWTGTMNLTEPNAGSDLAAVRTRAEPKADGSYKITGQKIFITHGEHDMAENIIHLVLARTPTAPAGVKGISLFVVPKFLVNTNGSLGERNDAWCASIEHKLGIHASPTAVMVFGDHGGATAYLVGEENRGLEYMFVMMNEARFAVGLQGVAISERAYQQALAYARDRIQGKDMRGRDNASVPIIRHPDVRRMLLLMKAQTEAMRAVASVVASALDHAHANPDAGERARNQAFAELMIPIVKGWCTENANDVTSLGIQIHGGMGFIEETGAAQHYRDARITAIYEGTTGIQALDLIGRKLARDGGLAARNLLSEMASVAADLAASGDLADLGKSLEETVRIASACVEYIVANFREETAQVAAGSVPFLKVMGIVSGSWQLGRSAMIAAKRLSEGTGDPNFYHAKIATARFYAQHVLPGVSGLAQIVLNGGDVVMGFPEEQF
jgi:acyl-CoA dehydrogenase